MKSRIQMLNTEHVEAFVVHAEVESRESGTDGDPVSTPYSKDEPFDREAQLKRTLQRWETPLEELDWRRAWGIFDGDTLAADLQLCGSALRSESHRVSLGMAVLRPYRRQGMGQALLETAIDWAKAQPQIAWIDLGVFGGNEPAYALYEKLGFIEQGRTVDRFRVDGNKVEDIHMCLNIE